MKKLKNLLKGVKVRYLHCSKDALIRKIETNSKKVHKGDLFIAIKGPLYDGNDYIEEAISKGAAAVITQKKLKDAKVRNYLIVVEDIDKAFVKILNNYYPFISKANIIGITGTNGKTTVSFLLKNILEQSGYKCGLIGTLGWKISNGRLNKIQNTTPGAVELAEIISKMHIKRVKYIIMEVSSHALSQNRVSQLNFKAAIFTNLSHEHLDYHKDMHNYLEAKKLLFKKVKPNGVSILNFDDQVYKKLKQSNQGKCVSYGLSQGADCRACNIALSMNKCLFIIKNLKKQFEINSKLCGVHNVYNILAACSCALTLKCRPKDIIEAISRTKNISGRLEKIRGKSGEYIYIDYAHTPDALKNVINLLSTLKKPQSKLICLFGCGGDRDKSKRPQMGRIAAAACNTVVVTSDNPRSENPETIINDIKRGIRKSDLKKCYFIKDRLQAIKKAVMLAKKDDLVLIAGKGHEKYQIFKNKIIPFSDYKVAQVILNEK